MNSPKPNGFGLFVCRTDGSRAIARRYKKDRLKVTAVIVMNETIIRSWPPPRGGCQRQLTGGVSLV